MFTIRPFRRCPKCGETKPATNEFWTRQLGTTMLCASYCRPCNRRPPRTFAERFWSTVDKNGPVPAHRPELGHCWIKLPRYGSPPTDSHGASHYASRTAWRLTYGDPGALQVCHLCDVARCARPSHLFLGTNQDNQIDSVRKGRRAHLIGERSGRALLTEKEVLLIRTRYAAGEFADELADAFSVRTVTIKAVVAGRNWRHVGGPRTRHRRVTPRKLTPRPFTDDQVRDIRARREAGESGVSLAIEFGVRPQTICQIYRRLSYCDVE
jgi:hypothetical protein